MIQCECTCVCCDTQVFLLPGAGQARDLACPSCGRPLQARAIRPFGDAAWEACDDPALLIQWRDARVTGRKKRLFAAACCRWAWGRLADARSRDAVAVAERFADGLATPQELTRAYERAAAAAAERAGNSWQDVAWAAATAASGDPHLATVVRALVPPRLGRGTEAAAHVASLFRDVLGNPWRPAAVDAAARAWDGGTAVQIAQRVYADQAFQDLPVLADALEEAGCTSDAILGHCRQQRHHVRGCWVLDAVLGQA
jgi:hypothetical protein